MTLTGRQIRDGRALVRLQCWQVARAAGVSTAMVLLAEAIDDEPPIPAAQAAAIRRALDRAGVKFTPDGPRLWNKEP